MKSNFKSVVWGLIILCIGLGLVLNKFSGVNFNIFAGLSVGQIILAIAFLGILIDSIPKLEFGGIFMSLAVLAIIFDEELHIEELTPWTVLVAGALFSISFSMIFKDAKHKLDYKRGNFQMTVSEENGDMFMERGRFKAISKYVKSENFKSGMIDSRFGGVEVFLDNAKVPSGECTINIKAKFSGVELFVPKEWTIVNNITVNMGGMEEFPSDAEDGSVTLTLNGTVDFGGVEIHRV